MTIDSREDNVKEKEKKEKRKKIKIKDNSKEEEKQVKSQLDKHIYIDGIDDGSADAQTGHVIHETPN